MSDTVGASRDPAKPDFQPLFTWRSAVCESALKATTRHVLLTLSLHMNERGGSCFPSVDTLASETGLNRATVIRQLQVAEANGWLVVSKSKGRTSNRYVAAIPPIEQPSRKTTVAENDGRTARPSHTATVAEDAANRRFDERQPSFSVRPTVAQGDPSSSVVLQGGLQGVHQERPSVDPKPRLTPCKPAAEAAKFEEFWLTYPRRVKRPVALKAYVAAMKSATEDRIIAGARAWADYWVAAGQDPKFIPHPSSWLNGHMWDDTPPPVVKQATRNDRNREAAARVASALVGASSLAALGMGGA